MTLTTFFIHSLEAVYFLLIIVTLFQIGKHYILSSVSSLKPKQKEVKPSSACRPAANLNRRIQNKPPSDHYFYKLPEPEVSISSEQSSAFLTQERPLTPQTSASKNKLILNNYIDNFFSAAPPTEAQEIDSSAFLNFQTDSAEEDEFITVIEPSTGSVSQTSCFRQECH